MQGYASGAAQSPRYAGCAWLACTHDAQVMPVTRAPTITQGTHVAHLMLLTHQGMHDTHLTRVTI